MPRVSAFLKYVCHVGDPSTYCDNLGLFEIVKQKDYLVSYFYTIILIVTMQSYSCHDIRIFHHNYYQWITYLHAICVRVCTCVHACSDVCIFLVLNILIVRNLKLLLTSTPLPHTLSHWLTLSIYES